jgi:hypothetical protein
MLQLLLCRRFVPVGHGTTSPGDMVARQQTLRPGCANPLQGKAGPLVNGRAIDYDLVDHLALSPQHAAVILGQSRSFDFPVTPDAYQPRVLRMLLAHGNVLRVPIGRA